MVKALVKLVLGLTALVAILFVALIILVDTNQYRSAIEAAVAENTGYELTIAGDLDFQLFPSLGLTLNDVRLKNPAYPQELASTSAISLLVNASALTRGQLLIQEFITDDFHVNFTIDENGDSHWDVPNSGAMTNSEDSADSGSELVSATFERISIANASIDIQDQSAGTRYSLSNANLDSSYTNIDGVPFPLTLQFDYVTYDGDTGLAEPMPISLRSIVSANLERGTIEISEFNFTLTPLLLQGQMMVSGLNDSLAVAGSVQASPFDVSELVNAFAPADEDPAAIPSNTSTSPKLGFTLNFNADESAVAISELAVTVGDSLINGSSDIRLATDFSPMSVNYSLASSSFDLSPYIASDEAPSAEPAADSASRSDPATQVEPEATRLPTELLSSINVIGSISVDSVRANDYLFEDINIYTNVESGVLDIEIQPIAAFNGTIEGTVRIDGRSPEALMTSQLNVKQLDLVDLAPSISRFNSVTGRLNVISEYTANAATTSSLLGTLSGTTQFAISENSVDIGVIKQIFTTISALSPSGGSIQQWPDQIQFSQLGGFIVVENGINENQLINLKMDNFLLEGVGGVDLDEGNFDYQLGFTLLGEPELQTIPIDELYHGVEWPVECAAPFAAEVSQYCRPDFTRVREIFGRIGANALRSEIEDTITDQVPENLRDTARGLLQNILN